MTLIVEIYQTAVIGAWSFNTQKYTENVFLRQIIVKAATSSTYYDFYIQDGMYNSNFPFDTRTDKQKAVGTLRREVCIPLWGIHTIGVVGSSKNELFTGKLVISEGRGNV